MQFTTNSDSKQLTADRPSRQLKNKRARCERAAIRTKKFGLGAVSLIQRKKNYITLTLEFISSCFYRLKIAKIWRRALVIAISKPMNPVRGQKIIDRNLCSVFFTRSSRGLSTAFSNQLLIYYYLESRLGFDAESQPWIKSFY